MNSPIATNKSENDDDNCNKLILTVYMCSRRFHHPPLYLRPFSKFLMTLHTMVVSLNQGQQKPVVPIVSLPDVAARVNQE